MVTSLNSAVENAGASSFSDPQLLAGVTAAVQSAGARLVERFGQQPAFTNRREVVAAIHANDGASLAVLRPALQALRPQAAWAEDELESGPLPPGEWWVGDPVEGNVNHVHAMTDWGVTATLVRDNVALLTVVHLPLAAETYTATRGGGAFRNGVALHPSAKRDLDAAIAGTGQAAPGCVHQSGVRVGPDLDARRVVAE